MAEKIILAGWEWHPYMDDGKGAWMHTAPDCMAYEDDGKCCSCGAQTPIRVYTMRLYVIRRLSDGRLMPNALQPFRCDTKLEADGLMDRLYKPAWREYAEVVRLVRGNLP